MEKVTKSNLKNGEILVGFRKQNKITQSELGKMVGLDSRDISKYEKGYRAIPQEAIDYLNSKYNLKLKSTGKVVKYKIAGKGITVVSPKSSIKVDKKGNVEISAKSIEVATKGKSFRTSSFKGSTFAKRLTSLRETLNMTQSAFAKKFHFEPSRLSRIESNKTTTVDIKSLKALSKAGYDIVSLIK